MARRGKRKRKDIITPQKILTDREKQVLADYLTGRRCGTDGKFVRPETISGQRNLLICEIFLATGLRANELCKLRVMDTPEVLGVDGIDIYRGKNDKDRTIAISPQLSIAIADYLKRIRPKTLPRHVRKGDNSKPVFYSQQRRPFTPNSLYRKVRQLGKSAGILKQLHPHIFRHTFATDALKNNVDLYVLQDLMGHTHIGITAKYLHFIHSQIDGLGEKLYQVLR